MNQVPPPPAPFSTARARTTVAVCAVFALLATLAVIARFWSRRLKRVKPALDDWLIVAGLIFYYLFALETILQVCLGRLGHHIDDGITPDQLIVEGKLGTFNQYAYALTMGFIRWSMCSLLSRIFVTKGFRRAILACSIVNLLWIIFSIFIVSFRCIPFSKNWVITESGRCLAQVPIVAAVAAWGLTLELTIWSLPIPATWQLQMPRSNKVAVSLIFGLGIFDIGVGVARVVTVLQVNEQDFSWSEVPALEWLAIEPSVAIIVACMCVCRPLLEKYLLRSWRHSFTSGRQGYDHIQLVGSKHGTVSNIASVTKVSSTGGINANQEAPEELQSGTVHVRKDIIVRSDSTV